MKKKDCYTKHEAKNIGSLYQPYPNVLIQQACLREHLTIYFNNFCLIVKNIAQLNHHIFSAKHSLKYTMVLFVSMTSSIIQMGPLLYSTSGSGLPPKLAFSLGARCSWLLVDFHVPAYCNTVRGTIPAELLSMCRPFSFCTALHCLHRSSNDALRVGSEGWVQPIRLVSAPWFHCSHLPTLWFFYLKCSWWKHTRKIFHRGNTDHSTNWVREHFKTSSF